MSNPSYFEIENGILTKYTGPGGHVVIPDDVTSIGDRSFAQHSGVTAVTIPYGVKKIGWHAFAECAALGKVEMSNSVVEIDWGAFSKCSSLTSVTIPGSVVKISRCAFEECAALKRVVIEDGVRMIDDCAFVSCEELAELRLPQVIDICPNAFIGCRKLADGDNLIVRDIFVDYFGDAAEVVIPDGIRVVSSSSFFASKKLEKVTIPEGVVKIGSFAFQFCYSLKTVCLPSTLRTVGYGAVPENTLCRMTVDVSEDISERLPDTKTTLNLLITVVDGEEVVEKYYMMKYNSAHKPTSYPYTSPRLNHARYDSFLAGNKGYYKLDGDQKLRAVLYRLRYPIGLTDEMRAEYTAFVAKYIKQASAAALEENDPVMLEILSGLSNPSPAKEPEDDSPLAAEYSRKFAKAGGAAQLTKMGLNGIALPQVRLESSGETAPASILKYILAEYGRQYISRSKREFAFSDGADAAAALLDGDSLRNALEFLRGIIYLPESPHLLAAYCRFGAPWQIEGLISDIKRWHDWNEFAHAGRYCEKAANDALMLSDTRAAMAYIDKNKRLDEYAALRNTTAEALRDNVLSDFGLEPDGSKVYDLGARKITAVLDRNLTFTLHDSLTRKVTKTLPELTADTVLHERAAADLAAMKKNLRGVVKIRTDLLFADFLSGGERSAEGWKNTYLPNPVLQRIAGLVVWSQAGRTFTLEEGCAVDCAGNVYELSDAPVGVAHPLDMDAAETGAWQEYFRVRKLKQLFEQVTEPVVDPGSITPDRYEGHELSVFKLMRQAKHGVTFVDEEFHTYIGFELKDCELEFVRTYPYHHEIGRDETFRFGKFSFERYTRQVNHIVCLFDRWLAEASEK